MAVVCRRPGREILVAVPTRGQIQWGTVTRLQQIRDAEKGLPPVLFQADHLSVAATRNLIVTQFLAGDWRVLVMIDDDVVPDERMLAITDHVPEFAMVGVPYLRTGETGRLEHTVYEEVAPGSFSESAVGLQVMPVGDGVERCAALGTGCVAIAREVLEGMEPPWFEMNYDREGRVISDDILFCQRLAREGLTVGVDWSQAADHHTTVSLAGIYMSVAV